MPENAPWLLSLDEFFLTHDKEKHPILRQDLSDALDVCWHLENCLKLTTTLH